MKNTILLLLVSLLAVGQAPRNEVMSGLLHSSIDLITSFKPFLEVNWKHETPKTERRIAKIQNGKIAEELDSKYKLGHYGTGLSIGNLTEDDNGVYIAEATLPDGTIIKVSFNLTVYEPVPPAQIIPEIKRTGDQCNVTLHCSAPSNTSDVFYSWKYRHGDSEYQNINDTGNTFHMMLPPGHQDMEFICIVYNPVDQKNVSFRIDHCPEKMKERTHIYIVFSVIPVLLVFVAVWICRKKSSKGDQNDKAEIENFGSPGQDPDGLKDEAENENLVSPVQDTETQDSKFFDLTLGKKKDSKLKDKPSCDQSVIEIESSE